ncbi:MAG: InlB B-repeat-containing protein [Paludibacteraceae bacterium]|nr:InlB B-repeat-containing protein [Paludibacteraceae bacterium]
MKKIFLYIAITLGLLSCNHKDSLWQEVVEDLDERVETLEMLCAEMNTNITSLQTIVDVLQSNDFITSIVEIKKDGKVVGYTITFGKHDPITIYHGQDGKDGQNGTNGKDGQDGADGKDGQNGADGKDGITPVIGVAQDTDGVYYWTLNGEWLLDDNGNKLPVSGKDGKDGVDGANGKDGQDGTDGKDGITPLLKIENGYWYISYDNGATWTESGKATGDNGQNGQNGTDGKDGQDGTNGQDGVTPLLKIDNGYWYISYDNGATWAQLGKATGEDGKDGANGTNGTDGKDGQDGADGSNGQDGITPQLKIENGYWYVSYDNGTTWTQFGKATGADGQDGQNGTDGKDGQDGKDGVTPQLKIEEGYWFISYDNGTTWTQLGKATGEDGKDGVDGEDGKDGQNGADGKDGQDGDSMFQSVTQDENYVYFTLADGTVIKIAKASEEEQPNSEFMFIVTYHANGGEGTMKPDTFYYGVSKQLSEITYTKDSHTFTSWNTKADGKGISYYTKQELMISKNITLYAQWEELTEHVDLGLSVKWATCNLGAEQPWEYGDYYAWGEVNTKSSYTQDNYKYGKESKMTKYCGSYTFGYQMFTDDLKTLEKEDDAAYQNKGDAWRIPTCAEIQELISSCTWTYTTLNGRNGYKVTSNKTGFTDRSIFLPCERTSNTVGYYWSSENQMGNNNADCASCLHFNNSTIEITWKVQYRYHGYSIRPVCP